MGAGDLHHDLTIGIDNALGSLKLKRVQRRAHLSHSLRVYSHDLGGRNQVVAAATVDKPDEIRRVNDVLAVSKASSRERADAASQKTSRVGCDAAEIEPRRDTSSCTDMDRMGDLSAWDTSAVVCAFGPYKARFTEAFIRPRFVPTIVRYRRYFY
mgnify:CR=1 FL=1